MRARPGSTPLAAAKSHAGALGAVQIATWDDYEEGTEVETGIDNHLAVSAQVSGGTLSWSLAAEANAPSDCTGAIAQGLDLASTVHHFAVYASSDGESLSLVADDLPATTTSLDLGALVPAGTTKLFVYAVGQPMIHNYLLGPRRLQHRRPLRRPDRPRAHGRAAGRWARRFACASRRPRA